MCVCSMNKDSSTYYYYEFYYFLGVVLLNLDLTEGLFETSIVMTKKQKD